MTNLSPINGSLRSTGRYAAISWVEISTPEALAASGSFAVTEVGADALSALGQAIVQGSIAVTESTIDVIAITGTARSSYLRPFIDITTGAWYPSTGSTLYDALNETVADNSDYIETQSPSSCEVRLTAAGTPLVKTNHILKYQLLSGIGSITVKLVQGASVIKSWTHTLTGSDQLIASELSEAEAQTITNYADLRVRFET